MAQQLDDPPPRSHDRTIPTSPRRRAAEAVIFVTVWVTTGYLLDLSSNAYLLLGIPLTLTFQRFVRRRPVRELFASCTRRFRLDRGGTAFAAVLAVVPFTFAVRSVADADWEGVGWYAAATVGAACAAFALRAGGVAEALRAALLPVAVGSVGMAAVLTTAHFATGAPLQPGAIIQSLVLYTALYFPATFLLEEVSFRGALDAHLHQPGDGRGLRSAVLVSALWGLWHLPVTRGLPLPVQVIELVVVHIALGVPLSLAWRRHRNLAGPGLAHAVNDAVRNGFMTGL